MRVVSLVPSLTELLFDLKANVVGRTKFCVHPRQLVLDCPMVGGTKNVSITKILGLNPDVVIANKEENTKETIEQLLDKVPVIITEIYSIEDSIAEITRIAKIIKRAEPAETLLLKLQEKLRRLKDTEVKSVMYLIWKDPLIAVGPKTYIHSVLQWMGFQNNVTTFRYPEVTWADIISNPPDQLFLSTEPYPFSKNHIQEFQVKLPDTEIRLVDGEWFSWYGTRLLKLNQYQID